MANIAKYRLALCAFMLGLILSGVTAFPLAGEMRLLTAWFGINPSLPPEHYAGLAFWLATVNRGLHETYAAYPWMAYGTDWLAFALIAIAVYFIGPLIDPLRNEWVLYAGLIGCALVLPLPLICGPLRGIPFYWRLIDCSFGVIGFVPLYFANKYIRMLETSA